MHKELQKQLGLPQHLVLGYISNESKRIPFRDEKAHESIKLFTQAKCLMTINPPLLNNKHVRVTGVQLWIPRFTS